MDQCHTSTHLVKVIKYIGYCDIHLINLTLNELIQLGYLFFFRRLYFSRIKMCDILTIFIN